MLQALLSIAAALGFCVGGTILSCAAAVLAARQQDKLATLTLLTTMLDFSDTGEIGLLIDQGSVALREAAIGNGGILPGKELAFTFGTLRANDLIWRYVVDSYLRAPRPMRLICSLWLLDAMRPSAHGIYLVHFIFLIWLQYIVYDPPFPAQVKFATVFAGTLSMS